MIVAISSAENRSRSTSRRRGVRIAITELPCRAGRARVDGRRPVPDLPVRVPQQVVARTESFRALLYLAQATVDKRVTASSYRFHAVGQLVLRGSEVQ